MTQEHNTLNDGSLSDRDLSILWATRDIVVATVGKPGSYDVPALIGEVHGKLRALVSGEAQVFEVAVTKPSASEIRKSITPDAIISFIDGKSYKSMRRHLTTHGLTPETYREKYGLPADYPIVAASYSAARSDLAKSMGLGQQRRKDAGVASLEALAKSGNNAVRRAKVLQPA